LSDARATTSDMLEAKRIESMQVPTAAKGCSKWIKDGIDIAMENHCASFVVYIHDWIARPNNQAHG
jgi:hypothetical protein